MFRVSRVWLAGVTLPQGFHLVKNYFEMGSESVGIDVVLHAEFIFDIQSSVRNSAFHYKTCDFKHGIHHFRVKLMISNAEFSILIQIS